MTFTFSIVGIFNIKSEGFIAHVAIKLITKQNKWIHTRKCDIFIGVTYNQKRKKKRFLWRKRKMKKSAENVC